MRTCPKCHLLAYESYKDGLCEKCSEPLRRKALRKISRRIAWNHFKSYWFNKITSIEIISRTYWRFYWWRYHRHVANTRAKTNSQ